jgi:CheY-like chemotaxis protein
LILVADSNAHIRFFLKREFMAAGFDVVFAKVHTEVLGFVQRETRPDLIVLDTGLPFIDWSSAVARIRSEAPGIPIIVYTPYAEDIENPVCSRADAIVEKTPDPALLISTARNLLAHSKMRAQNPSGSSLEQNQLGGEKN